MPNSILHSFVDDFYTWAQRKPHAACLVFRGQTTTYAALLKQVQGLREWIENHVSADQGRIAVLASQAPSTYAAILAILASGRAYVPINPNSPVERNANCLEQAGIETLLQVGGQSKLSDWLGVHGWPIQVVDTLGLASSDSNRPPAPVCATDLAYLLFTSGSTGIPKGVPIDHGNLNGFMQAIALEADFDFQATDRFLQMFDLTFDLSIFSFATPLRLGAACHVVTQEAVGYLEVAKILAQDKITVALMVPSVLSFLENYFDEIILPELRVSMFCGEALPSHLVTQWQKCCPHAQHFNVYGPTEATIFCTLYKINFPLTLQAQHLGVVSIGRPIAGTSLTVVDTNGANVADAVQGELVISGVQVTHQYWRNPEKTQLAFTPNAVGGASYRTGDAVFQVDGLFYYCGRLDFQIKVDGYRIEAGEVEFYARQLPDVRNVVLLGHSQAGARMRLYLFLETSVANPASFVNTCKSKLATQLPSYMVPQHIYCLETFPLNQNGKIDRKALLSGVGLQ